MAPEEEDIAFALEGCDGVAAVVALRPGGDERFVVALLSRGQREVAAVHYRLVRALGYAVAGRVRYVDATASPTSSRRRGEQLVLSSEARAGAKARADARGDVDADAPEPPRPERQWPEPPLLEPPWPFGTRAPARRALVVLSDTLAVSLVEANFVGVVVVAQDPRKPVEQRLSVSEALFAEALAGQTFTLVVAESWEEGRGRLATRGARWVLFRPRGFAPSPMAGSYDELACLVAYGRIP